MFVTSQDETGRTTRRFSGWVLLADVLGALVLAGTIGAAVGSPALKDAWFLALLCVPLVAVIIGFSPSALPGKAPRSEDLQAPVRITVIRYPRES